MFCLRTLHRRLRIMRKEWQTLKHKHTQPHLPGVALLLHFNSQFGPKFCSQMVSQFSLNWSLLVISYKGLSNGFREAWSDSLGNLQLLKYDKRGLHMKKILFFFFFYLDGCFRFCSFRFCLGLWGLLLGWALRSVCFLPFQLDWVGLLFQNGLDNICNYKHIGRY